MSSPEDIARSASEPTRWHRMVDVEALRREALCRILDAAKRAIQARGEFKLVVSGGQTPRRLPDAPIEDCRLVSLAHLSRG